MICSSPQPLPITASPCPHLLCPFSPLPIFPHPVPVGARRHDRIISWVQRNGLWVILKHRAWGLGTESESIGESEVDGREGEKEKWSFIHGDHSGKDAMEPRPGGRGQVGDKYLAVGARDLWLNWEVRTLKTTLSEWACCELLGSSGGGYIQVHQGAEKQEDKSSLPTRKERMSWQQGCQ